MITTDFVMDYGYESVSIIVHKSRPKKSQSISVIN